MDCSPPGLPVHHQLPELAQTHAHRVGDAIQPSHPLSSPSPPAFSLAPLATKRCADSPAVQFLLLQEAVLASREQPAPGRGPALDPESPLLCSPGGPPGLLKRLPCFIQSLAHP